MRRPTLTELRAAWWTVRAVRRARRALRRRGLNGFSVADPPQLPPEATRGVEAILRRMPPTCLERALVLQRWYARQGEPRDVVIGVRGPTRDFQAHAWLEGDPVATRYEELMRVPAR
jgi:hypothetical protein